NHIWTYLLRNPEELRFIQGNLNFELVNEMYFSSLTNTATLFVQKGDLETALSYYLLAKRIRPWEATADFNLGVVYARMKNCGQAEEMFLSAHRQFPYRIEPLQNLKVLYDQCFLSASQAETIQQEIDVLMKSLQTPLKTYW
ncbi:MAG TPA: tetratricopeptide repeat protein, partial [Candidatus Hodarchaeales archaeon]|nr:tetratricopeptide repeat protein [Candidatus Hodarchaeales archaeon]